MASESISYEKSSNSFVKSIDEITRASSKYNLVAIVGCSAYIFLTIVLHY